MDTSGAVQSVDRAARVLEILARDGESGVGRLARELGVHRSTASRLVSALRAHDLVERTEGDASLRLGVGVLRLAAATRSRLDLTAQAGPVRSEEHTSELQSRGHLVCRLLLQKKTRI